MSNRKQLVADITPFGVRLPDGLRERIKSAAASNNRSMNAEVVATLLEAYPAPLNIRDYILETRDRALSLQKFPNVQTVVDIGNALQEIEHALTQIQASWYSDEDRDPNE